MFVRSATLSIALAVPLLAGCRAAHADRGPAELRLAQGGTTQYRIVRPSSPSVVDEYAVRELGGYLKQITGAEFPVVDADGVDAAGPAIFVGLSAPSLKRLGKDPLPELKAQEYVARSIGADIFLYGKGIHGNLNAAMEFLETSLGWRWFSAYEGPVVPSRPDVVLAPFDRKGVFSFAYRNFNVRRNMDFYYQNRTNMGFDGRVATVAKRTPETAERLRSFRSEINDVYAKPHTLFDYIPPSGAAHDAEPFAWLERKNYFETNPEYFSMWEDGQRSGSKQLCFANPGLRKELTKNVLKHIEAAGGGAMVISIAAMDNPGPFCYCIECQALEKKYRSPGGPIYDYVIELGGLLQEKHPGVLVKTLAYRRSQTQKPPTLAEGRRLPPNVVVDFAAIEDCYFADWTHPDPGIQESYRDLQAWGKITDHLWAWLYPNPWGTGMTMPVGNVERCVTSLRMLAKAGVEGVFTDHCGFNERSGWSELQQYLLVKLARDIDADATALTREFTDHFYGPAAPLMRTYIGELEAGRKAIVKLPPGVNYRSPNYDDRTFPYLTPENIHRWQGYFDRMEPLIAGQPERVIANVQLARRELDMATLWKWAALKKQSPEYYKDHATLSARLAAANKAGAVPLGVAATQDFVTLIECGGEEKSLPAEFAGIDPKRIASYVPKYSSRRGGKKLVKDAQAALGYGVPVHKPDLPFNFGFHQNDTKAHGARRALEAAEIKPGYHVYKLGEVTLTPDCIIWFSAKSWATQLAVGERLYEPGEENRWEVYVSMRFDGPSFTGKVDESLLATPDRAAYDGPAKGDLVLVDRIILVRKERKP